MPSTPPKFKNRQTVPLKVTNREKIISALRTALSNFSGADDSEIREALKILGAKP